MKIEIIKNSERANAITAAWGMDQFTLEYLVYESMEGLSADYKGGLWEFARGEDGTFFMYPKKEGLLLVECYGNHFSEYMKPETAGLTACLFALNSYSWLKPESEKISKLYYRLKNFAMEHEDALQIMRAID